MQTIDIIIENKQNLSTRCKQIAGMFDVPIEEKSRLEWHINTNGLNEKKWNVGLIVGPSGSGKSTIGNHLYSEYLLKDIKWDENSVIDNFPKNLSLEEICSICSSVGFNTIPAWFRNYAVLSNGEKFRIDLARRLAEEDNLIVVDEFTSVVDRQVAKIGSHSVQKIIRKQDRQFVGISCHYDIIDWLQPDWIIDASKQSIEWRSLRQRPKINVQIRRVSYDYWKIFSKYHYMSNTLNKSARCYGLFIDNNIIGFCAILHNVGRNTLLKKISRIVILPDWQGLGLSFVLAETIASAYISIGYEFRNYPAHPSYIKAHKKSKNWRDCGIKGFVRSNNIKSIATTSRYCNPFEYVGKKMDKEIAIKFIGG